MVQEQTFVFQLRPPHHFDVRYCQEVSSPPSNAQLASRFPPVSEASQTSRLLRHYALPSKPLRNGRLPRMISSVLLIKKPGDEKVSSALGDIVR